MVAAFKRIIARDGDTVFSVGRTRIRSGAFVVQCGRYCYLASRNVNGE